MKYMLDTNTCIFLIKRNPEVMSSYAAKKSEGIVISSIVLAELEFGVCNSTAYEKNKANLLAFLSLVEILSFNGAAATEYGNIRADLNRKGTPIGFLDTLIAAHAKSKGLVIVTNNIREFGRVEGLEVEDWTAAA